MKRKVHERALHRPKVLFLHQGGELYGSDIIFYQVVKAASQCVDPIVVLSEGGPLVAKLKKVADKVLIYELGVLRRRNFNFLGICKTIYYIVKAVLWLIIYIKREPPRFIYSNTIGVLPGAIVAKILGIPHIWHIHEIIVTPKVFGRFLSVMVTLLSNKVIAVSKAVKDYLTQGGLLQNSEKVVVVHNGIQTTPFEIATSDKVKAEFKIHNDDILIGVIGRIHFWKGQDQFIEAVKILKEMGLANFKALIVGGVFRGYEYLLDELRAKVSAYGLEDVVVFCGYRRDIPEILKALDIVVVPSIFPDPFPTIVLEAMAAGKPVIATAHGGVVEMVQEGSTGFLVPPNRPDILAERIIKLAQDKALRERMGRAGRQRLKEKFTEKQFTEKIIGIILNLS